jgi:UDP-N-acetylglucosamine:LPS N-acetylglucosamine transferase
VPPAFHPVASEDEKMAARKKFGLPLDEPLVALVGGAGGMGDVRKSARDIAQTGLARPVVVCGRNEATRAAIEEEGHAIALGWVTEMPTLLRACDVAVQNAGGLSSLEALATGIPVLTYRSITGHGRDNSAALDESGWVKWVKHKRDLPEALQAALSGIPNTAARAASHPPIDPADTIAELARQEVEPMGRRRIVRRLRRAG